MDLELGHERIRERRGLPAPSLSALLGVTVLVLIAAAAVHLSLRGTAVPLETEQTGQRPEQSAGVSSAAPSRTASSSAGEGTSDGGEGTSGGDEDISDGDATSMHTTELDDEAATSDPPREVVVHVSGAVADPGVVRVRAPARVDDAVQAAGGATGEADLAAVNLARLIEDGEQVHVPRPGEEPPVGAVTGRAEQDGTRDADSGGDAAGGGEPSGAGTIDINTADAQQLEELPGVGPAIAERIIGHREANGPFRSPDDLLDVSGIGPATLEKMRDRIAVGG